MKFLKTLLMFRVIGLWSKKSINRLHYDNLTNNTLML